MVCELLKGEQFFRRTSRSRAAAENQRYARNDNMKKIKKKTKKAKRAPTPSSLPALTWMDDEGMHLLAQGTAPSPDQLEEMTKKFQERIRKSPMWEEMVRTFGKEKAEELLLQCRAKLK
jgi:hypothetical protein